MCIEKIMPCEKKVVILQRDWSEHESLESNEYNKRFRNWAQELVILRIKQMELEDEETMSIEDAREMTLAAVREEYAKA